MGHKKSSNKIKTPTMTTTTTQNAVAAAPIAPTVQTPTTSVVTPAVARDLSQDTNQTQENQSLARSRLRGIRSTWSMLGGPSGSTSTKLGN